MYFIHDLVVELSNLEALRPKVEIIQTLQHCDSDVGYEVRAIPKRFTRFFVKEKPVQEKPHPKIMTFPTGRRAPVKKRRPLGVKHRIHTLDGNERATARE